ncbi:MAG: alpha/beta fold hydrolase [Myxococcales bacterium]|nr:alpha/beta fold hydrolase [Myxococcales bacterium]
MIHGYRRAFVHVGSGPALLLIHGIGNDLDGWRHVIPQLARDYTVIAPDLLGHGRSDKPRADYSVAAYANGMRDLLSVLDIERVTVVGHSLGGGVATQFAYQYPERCERLVLVSSGGVGREVLSALRLATAPCADSFLALLNNPAVERTVRAYFRAMATIDADIALDAKIVLGMFDALRDATSRQAFVRTLRAVVDLRGQVVTMLDRCYLTVGMPTLLVWGGRDAVIPVEHGRTAHAAMPGSQLEIFPDAGHFPHHHDPERFVGVLRAFLETTEPTAYSVGQWRRLLRAGRPGLPAAGAGSSAQPMPPPPPLPREAQA